VRVIGKAILGPVSVSGALARERFYSLTASGGKLARKAVKRRRLNARSGGEPGLNRAKERSTCGPRATVRKNRQLEVRIPWRSLRLSLSCAIGGESNAILSHAQEPFSPGGVLRRRVPTRRQEDVKGGKRTGGWKGSKTARIALASAALVALPTAGLALDSLRDMPAGAVSGNVTFTPATVDPRVAGLVGGSAATGRMIRFTPAGLAERPNRSVTVAVRVDEEAARAIQVRSAIAAAQDQVAGSPGALRIAPTRYNLGISRGYQRFAQASVLDQKLSNESIPDLASFRPSPGARPDESRFAPRIALEQDEPAGSTRLTRDALGSQSVDVGGSYRLTRNLDVTAGVRYEQDRNRLAPLADPKEQDSQAVYIGTQFRF
jgi:hypothetical protein